MGYRNIFLTNRVRLSVRNEQLVIDNGEETRIPLEDIECIVSDNPQISVTSYLLMKFSEYAITYFVSDKKHSPCGVFLPVSRHSRHLSVLKDQIDMTLPVKKQLWKQIVKQKIENQAAVLKLCCIEGWNTIDNLKNKVKSGDSTNMEAVAASQYFKLLFGKNFTRVQENTTNAMLNYGYAILRSTISKFLVVYGYEPSLGLFHKSTLNSFNLSDDIIEAYRPIVDLFVKRYGDEPDELSVAIKAQLVNLLSVNVIIDSKLYACSRAIELTIQSLSSYISGNRTDLLLPQILDLEQHSYE